MQRTDFKKLIDNEITKSKANLSSSSASQKAQMLRKFQEAIWNVHHSGQPMPGEENEDIVMTGTECSILNKKCPVTGIQVTELAEPVRSVDCKHIYEKQAILLYVASKNNSCPCPVAGCPKYVNREKVLCDPMLLVEIEDLRKMSGQGYTFEDFTRMDEDENEDGDEDEYED